jgi:hypothetical protein
MLYTIFTWDCDLDIEYMTLHYIICEGLRPRIIVAQYKSAQLLKKRKTLSFTIYTYIEDIESGLDLDEYFFIYKTFKDFPQRIIVA